MLDVITGADIVAAGWKTPPVLSFFKGVGGSSVRIPFRPGLAHGRVRFVGEPVAVVIAETEHLAQDAAEKIEIEYEDLPVVVDASEALKASAPRVHDEMPDNLCFEYEYGNSAGAEQAFAKAAHIIRVGVTAQRIAGNPMEPKSCLARYDAAMDMYDLYCPTQGISDIKAALASITGLDATKFRVHSNDVGGGFGVRNEIYPEFLAVLLAAKRTGKPVRWTGTRSETISGDHHARGADLKGELAIDDKGKFLGLRVEWLVNMGAYCSGAGALINTVAAPTSSATSLYKVPAFYGRHRLVFTNTTPITAYRGAGRPNVAYLWERLVEEAAATLGIDPVRLRRRNILAKTAFPMKTLTGHTYDSGDPARLLDTALQAADWDGFKARRKAAKKSGQLRGIGLAMFLEPSGAVGKEQIEIRIEPDGKLAMYSNAGPMGQGLETVLPEVVSQVLGMPEDRIELRFNDNSAPKLMGTGSFGSRSLISHGGALMNGAKEIVEKGKALAAGELEVSPNDVTFENGVYKVAGTDLSIHIRTLIEKKWSADAASARHQPDARHRRGVPERRAYRRGRDRSRHRRCADRELHRRRRLRQRHQPRHRRGPAPRRADAGHRPGAGRAHRLRPGHRAAPVRHLHGLLHAARAPPHADHADRLRRAVAGQSARRQGRGRGRRHRLGARARQRGDGRAQGGEREAP